MTRNRPMGLLAELTYRCPLHCPYCSNPLNLAAYSDELTVEEWSRVLTEAHDLGVLQLHLSGGEPLQRRDLLAIVTRAHELGFYTNLITSALSLTAAKAQYYGWALHNRTALLPTWEQLQRAESVVQAARVRLAKQMQIIYVIPDYYSRYPKPCMGGWGRQQLTVAPNGDVLPCPAAGQITALPVENVRQRSLAWIWDDSLMFNRFRGVDWMPEPCRSCPRQTIDFGGCRCQAFQLTGDAGVTDPVCYLSPDHGTVADAVRVVNSGIEALPELVYRS